jgi:hypothetical protein
MEDEQIREALNAQWHASAVVDVNAEHDIYCPPRLRSGRALHSTGRRFAMICSGRDDRIGEIGTSPVKPEPGLSGLPIQELLL